MNELQWQCGTCGEWHTGLPLDVAFRRPHSYFGVPEDEREQRIEIDADLCSIDNRDFFIRGVIEVPILGSSKMFCWGVWTTLSERNFRFVVDHRDDEGLGQTPPMFGWLNNSIEGYPETLNLKTNVQLHSNRRPSVLLEPTDHPLAVEQREGITWQRVREIVAVTIHH